MNFGLIVDVNRDAVFGKVSRLGRYRYTIVLV